MKDISPNTQAVLLLTSNLGQPLEKQPARPMTPARYNELALHLHHLNRTPSDLLGAGAGGLIKQCESLIEADHISALLHRGFMLSSVLERWGQKAIWVVSRSDPAYPKRLKQRLKKHAPVLLFGCGNAQLMHRSGGLAVVGSRDADDDALQFSRHAGVLAANAGRILVSGGAKGVDSAAMAGAGEAGGEVCGVLADSLEKACMKRENRDLIRDGRMLLVSPFEPSARFQTWTAMDRNKLIYALADAALVVSATFNKRGTWNGAVEQLDKHRFLPVYVRNTDPLDKGLQGLCDKGARLWPREATVDDLDALFAAEPAREEAEPQVDMFAPAPSSESPGAASDAQADKGDLSPGVTGLASVPDPLEPTERAAEKRDEVPAPAMPAPASRAAAMKPADALWRCVHEALPVIFSQPVDEQQFAEALDISRAQAREWLQRLVDEGRIEKLARPVRYQLSAPDSNGDIAAEEQAT